MCREQERMEMSLVGTVALMILTASSTVYFGAKLATSSSSPLIEVPGGEGEVVEMDMLQVLVLPLTSSIFLLLLFFFFEYLQYLLVGLLVFSSATAGDSFNYCAVWDRLHEKYLPPASNLQYVNYVRQGTMATIAGDSVVHMTDKDVGTLSGPRVPTECKMPPPPPSPPPPPPPPPPAPPSAPPVSSTSNSLSDGEIAGVAVGAGLGAILLLLFIGLVLRAFLFKEAKPIFTCLEAKETTKTPAASVDPSKV